MKVSFSIVSNHNNQSTITAVNLCPIEDISGNLCDTWETQEGLTVRRERMYSLDDAGIVHLHEVISVFKPLGVERTDRRMWWDANESSKPDWQERMSLFG